MEEVKMVKCEIVLDRIFYPKWAESVESGEYSIFSSVVVSAAENCNSGDVIKFKGVVPKLEFGTVYKIIGALAEHHEIYGDTYEIVYITKRINISDKEMQKELLSNILPDSIIENLYNAYDDVLSLIEYKDTEALCKVKGIKESTVKRIYSLYDEIKDYSNIFVELGKSGLSGNFIKKITDYYNSPDTAIDVVKNRPYDLVAIDGIGFKKADEIALKMGVDKFAVQRIKGFLMHTLLEQGELGKSYLHYSELMKSLYDTLGFIPEEKVLETAKNMMDNKDVWVSDDGERIALYKYYNLEKSIKNEIVRLLNNAPENLKTTNPQYVPKDFDIDDPEEIIDEVEQEQGFDFTDEQKEAIYTCLNNQVVAITGGAGVGKTSTANGICQMFKDYSIMAVALSGKAALRITEATGLPASTIHRGLGWLNGDFTYNKYNKLSVDIILIDEATMINGTLFKNLLEAIPSGAKVIIMGDVQQLTPIGNCQVFADMLESEYVPTVRLTKPHRQALRSGIIPTSIKIANQEQIFDKGYQGYEIIGDLQDMELNITKEKVDLSDYVIEKFKQEYEKFQDVVEVQVISALKNRGNLCCYNLNNKIQSWFNPVLDGDPYIKVAISKGKTKDEDKIYKIKIGDKVINTKNNYRCLDLDGNPTPVFNGNIGVVADIQKNGAAIDFVGIGRVWFDSGAMKNLELGYCISIHKSQGSGFKSTIIGLDDSSYIMNNAELLYTAVTRAKKYCVLVATNSAVRTTISKKEVNTKQTFLKEMLAKCK